MFALDSLCLPEIVSFTAAINLRSEKLIRRLGFELDGHFEHPLLPEGQELRRHVLYRLKRPTRSDRSECFGTNR